MNNSTVDFKRGGTFSFGCLVQMPAGTWSAASKLRDAGGVQIAALDVTLTPPVAPSTQHTLLIAKAASVTAAWPLGPLSGDVAFTDTSVPPVELPTSTFTVNVLELQTK